MSGSFLGGCLEPDSLTLIGLTGTPLRRRGRFLQNHHRMQTTPRPPPQTLEKSVSSAQSRKRMVGLLRKAACMVMVYTSPTTAVIGSTIPVDLSQVCRELSMALLPSRGTLHLSHSRPPMESVSIPTMNVRAVVAPGTESTRSSVGPTQECGSHACSTCNHVS